MMSLVVNYLIVFLGIFGFSHFATSQVVNIPDTALLNYLISEGIDLNADGMIQLSEADQVVHLTILDQQKIFSIEGLNSFRNLESLLLSSTSIVSYDLSGASKLKKLHLASNNFLTDLNLNGLTSLTSIYCIGNDAMNELDIVGNESLSFVYVSSTLLKSMNLVDLPSLKVLNIGSNAWLKSLHLNGLDSLTNFSLRWNTSINKFELSDAKLLSSFEMQYVDGLDSLFLFDLPSLKTIDISDNDKLSHIELGSLDNIVEVDIHNNPSLERILMPDLVSLKELRIWYNRLLIGLRIWGLSNLEYFYFKNNDRRQQLDLRTMTNLRVADISYNNFLKGIDVSGLKHLKILNIRYNPILTTLELASADSLEDLTLYGSERIASLDFMHMENIVSLKCSGNIGLLSLNVAHLPKLRFFNCNSNGSLKNLSLNNLDVLEHFEISYNNLEHLEFENLQSLTSLSCNGLSGLDTLILVDLINLRNLQIRSLPKLNSLKLDSLPKLDTLEVSGMQNLQYLNLERLTNLSTLDCSYNVELKQLDVNVLPSLENFVCNSNAVLDSLNVRGLPKLENFNCHSNRNLSFLNLQDLDMLKNVSLKYNAELMNLELKYLPNLFKFNCKNSALTSLVINNCIRVDNIELVENYFLESINLNGLDSLSRLNVNKSYTGQFLDLSEFINLSSVNIEDVNVDSINLANLSLLDSLTLSRLPKLKALDLSDLNDLEVLSLSSIDSLTAIELGDMPKIRSLVYFVIPLAPAFDFRKYRSLEYVTVVGIKGMRELDLSGLNELRYIECRYNWDLEILNLNGCIKLYKFIINNNTNLEIVDLFTDRNDNGSKLYRDVCTISSQNNLLYICANREDIYWLLRLVSYTNSNSCQVGTDCFINIGQNHVEGAFIYDDKFNGCDSNDLRIPFNKLKINDGTNTSYIFTKRDGSFQVDLKSANYTIEPIIHDGHFFNVTPEILNIDFAGDTSYQKYDFCLTARDPRRELVVAVAPTTVAQPGFDARYVIVAQNSGTGREIGSVEFTFPGDVMQVKETSRVPSSSSANSLIWDFTDFRPFANDFIFVTMSLNSPMDAQPLNGGEKLEFYTSITPKENDVDPKNNDFKMRQFVVNSFDPNDKICLEGNKVDPDFIGAYLHYMIRFENIGTANAVNVYVKDQIDTALFDINSLTVIESSHDMEVLVTDGNIVRFMFDSILLPFEDDVNDGFILFKIKTKPTLKIGDVLQNQAEIYFDYNWPIITNNEMTLVDDYVFVPYYKDNKEVVINVSPNPTTGILDIETDYDIKKIEVHDAQGQLLRAISLVQGQRKYTLDLSSHIPTMYYIQVHTDQGIASQKFVKQ